eukprot:CAMPEP_0170336474 /NCGR_PEP_ID=MMETSP0116_2-20130129/69280_1 /TAXON_ID=400756 /ORGANISM="Durinskia baltica, Strain CSIRO CS-38" /LENGTH=158 /DNA_ID=CAMNT_0010589863 /DNA_START=276 /DNA_END=752 /DNA_ORIENTATION=+
MSNVFMPLEKISVMDCAPRTPTTKPMRPPMTRPVNFPDPVLCTIKKQPTNAPPKALCKPINTAMRARTVSEMEQQICASGHPAGDAHRVNEASATQRALHICPLVEVLQDVAHTTQNAHDHATDDFGHGVFGIHSLPCQELECPHDGDDATAEANAAD